MAPLTQLESDSDGSESKGSEPEEDSELEDNA
jgi:hypothetical protein